MKPTVHMICGFIGSGKTTFAKRLAAQVSGFRLSTDAVMVAVFGHDPQLSRTEYDGHHAGIVALQRREAERLINIGVDVIFESGFWRRQHRDELRAFAARQGVALKMYYLQCTDEVMRARAIARSGQLDDETIFMEAATWDALRSQFEPPQADEVFEAVVTG